MDIIQENQTEERKNPFFSSSYGPPHDTAPFDRIHLEDYEPAFMEGIRQDDELTDTIIQNPEPPTFDNTISFSVPDNLLSRVSNVFFNLLSAETNDEMDELAQKMSPILTEHANNILLNEKLFARIKAVYENHRELTPEEQMLLDKSYDASYATGLTFRPRTKKSSVHSARN